MSTENPLIDPNDHYQSLHNIQCALSYFSAVSPTDDNRLTDNQQHGRWLSEQFVLHALEHEKERGQALERAAPKEGAS